MNIGDPTLQCESANAKNQRIVVRRGVTRWETCRAESFGGCAQEAQGKEQPRLVLPGIFRLGASATGDASHQPGCKTSAANQPFEQAGFFRLCRRPWFAS